MTTSSNKAISNSVENLAQIAIKSSNDATLKKAAIQYGIIRGTLNLDKDRFARLQSHKESFIAVIDSTIKDFQNNKNDETIINRELYESYIKRLNSIRQNLQNGTIIVEWAIYEFRDILKQQLNGRAVYATALDKEYTFASNEKRLADTYEMVINGKKIKIILPTPDENAAKFLGENKDKARITHVAFLDKLLDQYSKLPPHLISSVETIIINPGSNPDDKYWKEKYKKDNFQSAATGGNKQINYFNVFQNSLDPNNLYHEVGHNVHESIKDQVSFNNGWDAAIKADNKPISEYGKSSLQEDFAESFMKYITVKNIGNKELEEFQKAYPERAKILKQIIENKIEMHT